MGKYFILFLIILIAMKSSTCQRRLVNSSPTISEKKFMAYLVSSSLSEPQYDSWVCGGAIVSPQQILTSGACLTSLSHIYAIAGYRKYVNGRGIEFDECTKRMKQKVVSYSIPYNYTQNESNWEVLDVGVAVVEKPFDFADTAWKQYCSWIPGPIRVSYKHHEVFTDVVAFGWGGDVLRSPKDIRDLNREYLHEIYSMIAEKDLCERNNANSEIYKWIYCVSGDGNLDGDGNQFEVGMTDRSAWDDGYAWDNRRGLGYTDDLKVFGSGTTTKSGRKAVATNAQLLKLKDKHKTTIKQTTHKPQTKKLTTNKPDTKKYKTNKLITQKLSAIKAETQKPEKVTDTKISETIMTKKEQPTYQTPAKQKLSLQNPAICTGDHGGPLVTWEGNEMVLIGVAVSSKVNSTTNGCTKPSLFTSTYCAGLIIDCLLRITPTARRSCNSLEKKDGIVINETNVNWGSISESESEEKDAIRR